MRDVIDKGPAEMTICRPEEKKQDIRGIQANAMEVLEACRRMLQDMAGPMEAEIGRPIREAECILDELEIGAQAIEDRVREIHDWLRQITERL